MDQNIKMHQECTGARALMSSASERFNTDLWMPHLPTPPFGGFRRSVCTAEFARVLAPHVFYTMAFLWLGILTAGSINSVGAGTEESGRGYPRKLMDRQ